MLFKEWEILIVDDEQDVLDSSRLVMKNFRVYGLPLKIHTAKSGTEAIEFFKKRLNINWVLSVAIIDVVMETETAGLALCQYIREELDNKLAQIYIRTGQPGIITERKVVDRYDVNGYFTKIEATDDKLYTLIKSGVRQFLWSWMSLTWINLLHDIIAATHSRIAIAQKVEYVLGGFRTNVHVEQIMMDAQNFPRFLMIGGDVLTEIGINQTEAAGLKKRLGQLDGTRLSKEGDKHVRDDLNYHLIQIANRALGAETFLLLRTPFTPPDYMIAMLHKILLSLEIAWHQAE